MLWQTMFDGGNAETPITEYEYLLGGVHAIDLKLRGIFDESAKKDDRTGAIRRVPRVTLFAVPSGNKKGVPIIVRGKEYKIDRQEVDANIGIVLWLR